MMGLVTSDDTKQQAQLAARVAIALDKATSKLSYKEQNQWYSTI